MKNFLKAAAYFIALLMTACATFTPPNEGHTYTDPINVSVASAQANIGKSIPMVEKTVKAGALPNDAGMISVDTNLHLAQKELDVVPGFVTKVNTTIDGARKTITTQNTVITKQAHRIFIDDAFAAGILSIAGIGLFLEFGLPLLKLLAL